MLSGTEIPTSEQVSTPAAIAGSVHSEMKDCEPTYGGLLGKYVIVWGQISYLLFSHFINCEQFNIEETEIRDQHRCRNQMLEVLAS